MNTDELIKKIMKIPNVPSDWDADDVINFALNYVLSNSDAVEESLED